VIIFNEGQEGRTVLLDGTLGRPFTVPVIGLSFADGAALQAAATAGPVTATVSTSTESVLAATTTNVIATSDRGDEDEQVIVGAHLDSVVEGPGINDNGSGTSQNLEIAEEMAELNIRPRRQLKFAFWGAEESGLLGSEHYVDQLGPAGIGQVYANLNFDMTGLPNYVRFVYDGDGSDTPLAGPRLGPDRVAVHEALQLAGPRLRADGVQRPLGLRPVHRGRRAGRRPVLGRRGDQDGGAGGHLRRHRRDRLRPVLPPGVRHDQEREHQGARGVRRRVGARDDDAGPLAVGAVEDGSRRATRKVRVRATTGANAVR